MEQVLNDMIQVARAWIRPLKQIKQPPLIKPNLSAALLLPLTGRTSKSLFTLCLSIPLARDIAVEAETENLKWYFDCPKPACHNFADEDSILEILQFCNNYTHPEVRGNSIRFENQLHRQEQEQSAPYVNSQILAVMKWYLYKKTSLDFQLN